MKVVSIAALVLLVGSMVALYLAVTRRSRGIGRKAERAHAQAQAIPEPGPPAEPAPRSRITLPDGTTVDPADPADRRRAREMLESMDPAARDAFLAKIRRR
jgi:hypothetical protein